MNYKKLYKTLIAHCRKEKRNLNDPKFTVHHILPRSMGGIDEPKNRVLMTPKEHYLAHRVLAHIYKKRNPEICYLLNKFANGMKGPDSPKYSNFNFYLNQIVTFKKNGKPKSYDAYCAVLRNEIIHLMDLPINKSLLTNKLMGFVI
jgi:hypothetical protein